jgi:hypothetical protein
VPGVPEGAGGQDQEPDRGRPPELPHGGDEGEGQEDGDRDKGSHHQCGTGTPVAWPAGPRFGQRLGRLGLEGHSGSSPAGMEVSLNPHRRILLEVL